MYLEELYFTIIWSLKDKYTYTLPTSQFYHKLKARSHVTLAGDELIQEMFSGSQQLKAPLLSAHFDNTPLKSVRPNVTAAAKPPPAN